MESPPVEFHKGDYGNWNWMSSRFHKRKQCPRGREVSKLGLNNWWHILMPFNSQPMPSILHNSGYSTVLWFLQGRQRGKYWTGQQSWKRRTNKLTVNIEYPIIIDYITGEGKWRFVFLWHYCLKPSEKSLEITNSGGSGSSGHSGGN